MHTEFIGQAVSKEYTRARWFYDWLRLLVRINLALLESNFFSDLSFVETLVQNLEEL